MLGRKSGRGFYDYRGVDALARPAATSVPVTPQASPEAAKGAPRTRRAWVSAVDPQARQRVVGLLAHLGADIDDRAVPDADSLCVVLPSGGDATSAALDEGVDPKRTVALDTLFDLSKHRTLMTTSVTERQWLRCRAAHVCC